MAGSVDIIIIGSGPYGLSLAAHLRRTQCSFRIFGKPMRSWTHHMPRGMSLKSEGFASNLSDPDGAYPLKAYCAEKNIPYADIGLPVRLETFVRYGLEFQKRYVPTLEEAQVTSLRRTGDHFDITTDTGETVSANQVVVAAGIRHFDYLPPMLTSLPQTLISHSSWYSNLSGFKGKKVLVLGAGASAIDIAVLLKEAGTDVELVARASAIQFHAPPDDRPRSFLDRIKAPRSGLGLGWRSRLSTDVPLVFHTLPQSMRLKAVNNHLGPAPCWFTRDAVVGKLPMHLGVNVVEARAENDRIRLILRDRQGLQSELAADHLIAATGYRVALARLAFLESGLRSQINAVVDTPILNRRFESSVEGLYFVGVTAANSFGPMLRFAYGADYTARRLAPILARSVSRSRTNARTAMEPA
jgi:thioredoxin reductase